MYMCPILHCFRDRAISLYSSLDLAPNVAFPSCKWISVKRQLAVVTAGIDIVGVLWKMPHIFTNAEYADMLSSQELQSALMLQWDFRKYIAQGRLYQLCHLDNKYRYYKQQVISFSYQKF
jgi:hypothetical protein